MNSLENDRRNFLKALGAAAAIAAIPVVSTAAQTIQPAAIASSQQVLGNEVLEINLVGSLNDVPMSVELAPGEISNPIPLKGKGTYRVKAVPYKLDPRWGQSYTFHLMDADGKDLDRMIIGSHSSATFLKYGVQAELLAIHRAS